MVSHTRSKDPLSSRDEQSVLTRRGAACAGFFISAPLGHTLLGFLQRAFAGKTSSRAKLGMILASNLFISPIQQSVYSKPMPCPDWSLDDLR